MGGTQSTWASSNPWLVRPSPALAILLTVAVLIGQMKKTEDDWMTAEEAKDLEEQWLAEVQKREEARRVEQQAWIMADKMMQELNDKWDIDEDAILAAGKRWEGEGRRLAEEDGRSADVKTRPMDQKSAERKAQPAEGEPPERMPVGEGRSLGEVSTTKAYQAMREERRNDHSARAETTRDEAVREGAERQMRVDTHPVVWPSAEEISAAAKRVQYSEGVFHIAIAGIAGSGKSSLINALRGISNSSKGINKGSNLEVAPTGIIETTSIIGRYVDPDPEKPFVWYDIPGAGTLKIPGWQYFNTQGLYIFDCIVILFDNRFTETDIALLQNCARFGIPSFVVGSKSQAKIAAIVKDMQDSESDSDEEDRDEWDADHGSYNRNDRVAREKYIKETNESVLHNLAAAGLPPRRVYLVDKDVLRKVVRESSRKNSSSLFQNIPLIGRKPSREDRVSKDGKLEDQIIDERNLLNDMLRAGYERTAGPWWFF
ncbi:interferon-inducible GTPase-domain-containing protein [Sparassis latifolia]